MLFKRIFAILSSFVLVCSVNAIEMQTTDVVTKADPLAKKRATYENVIEEYKRYLSDIKPTLRDEIRNFRKEIERLSIAKRKLYKSLSHDAQLYLKKQQEFKSKLPIQIRNEIKKAENESIMKHDVKIAPKKAATDNADQGTTATSDTQNNSETSESAPKVTDVPKVDANASTPKN